ncbi:NADH dehydrogenase Fe-S protein subunit 4 ndufs4 [Phytophthora pseudosyringae]|uniref:Trehalose 6-phosphate phosphatase n=1 Tax=Phytophthora pseudosyringae TaxID=221518 RepID=A0A8T1VZ36_9STRA|nr:NADH dehydrogenase Fe-S protein subunit 4 ndufs4 [Phytophthora pseudosyringae]
MLHPTNAFRDLDSIKQKVAGKRPVVFLDYDGTLSPIVDVPDHAFMTDTMRAALSELSSKFVTAIVTGRSTEKVYNFVQLDNLVYAGSHGFDIKGTKTRPINCQVADHFRPELEQALRDLTELTAHIGGAELEDNGLAMSVHYRHPTHLSVLCVTTGQVDPALQNAVEQIVDDYVAYHPSLTKKMGKMVFELRPRVDWDKGRAVMYILSELGLDAEDVVPFYLGDDVSDEDAFNALNGRGIGQGISIIVRDPEAVKVDLPGNLKELPVTKASYSLRDTAEVQQFLTELAGLEYSPGQFAAGRAPPPDPTGYSTITMSARVLQASTRAAAAVSTKRAAVTTSSRAFSELAKDEEAAKAAAAAAEEKLMTKLREQKYTEAERTILPFHATEAAFPTIEKSPMPFPEEAAIVSGTGEWSVGRKAKLFKPARNQMQSGIHNTKHWEIRFEAPRTWGNPLMGWTSTADPYVGLTTKFDTKEEAEHFAKKQGWELEIFEPAPVGDYYGKISYSHNFLPEHVETLIKQEGKKSAVQFKHPTGRRSNWVKTLKYRGDGVVAQHGGEAKE